MWTWAGIHFGSGGSSSEVPPNTDPLATGQVFKTTTDCPYVIDWKWIALAFAAGVIVTIAVKK